MPSSHFLQLNEIMELVVLADPAKMLDIGIGFGKYGFLSREYLELWDGRNEYHSWTRQIDGIEAYEPYLNPAHQFIYSKIFTGDALQILPGMEPGYDLVLLVDVLEHFSEGDGLLILKECRRISRNILISAPRVNSEQDSIFNNPYEAHKFQWTRKDFKKFPEHAFIRNNKSLICFMGEDAERIVRTFKKNRRYRCITGLLDLLRIKGLVKFILRKS